jgi:tetratricopeptide (TPR) repeat protein
MTHLLARELLRASDAGRAEVERMAAHLGVCPACRALVARLLENRTLPAKREAPLRSLLELAAFEQRVAVERLLVRAEFADLTRRTRAVQKRQVIQSPSCHSPAFIDLLVAAVRAPHPREEAEFLSSLAVLAVQRMDEKKNPPAFRNDLLGTIWTETANARRIHGEWSNALTALERARGHLEAGTGNSLLKARRLSIAASLQSDLGARDEAMALLAECVAIYEAERNWPLAARTLVQMAHSIVDHEPARGLALLDRASVSISPADPTLRWLAESNRAECLVTMGRVEEALAAFSEAECLRPLQQRPNGSLRSTFTAARLLELLGHTREADILFTEALAGDLEAGLHKDALLDLLYIFGFHARRGEPEQAAKLSLRTFAEIERQDTVLHEQLRSVWTKLIEAARAAALDESMLLAAGDYLRAHWKYPAATEPVLAGRPGSFPPGKTATAGDENLVAPLLARALWSRIRHDSRKNQQAQVAASPECHTRAFAELLLAGLSAAPSRDEAEFIANLALRAAEGMAEPGRFAEDFLGQVWTEVANARRKAAEWQHARAALRRSEEHLSRGSADPLLKGRLRSVTASLSADQGRYREALAILEECQAIYEEARAWPLVARTLVQAANTLVDHDPERALALAEKALPLIPTHDAVLRWLAESIRTESLIEMGEISRALQAFEIAEFRRSGHARAGAGRRSTFTAARLLEGLGHVREAEQLFEAVIADGFEREAYREAFLDILYLFGMHIRRGAMDKAVALCRLALARLDLFEIGNEQLRTVWSQLRDAAMQRAIRLESLVEVREFLKVHWKTPAAKAPSFPLTP